MVRQLSTSHNEKLSIHKNIQHETLAVRQVKVQTRNQLTKKGHGLPCAKEHRELITTTNMCNEFQFIPLNCRTKTMCKRRISTNISGLITCITKPF